MAGTSYVGKAGHLAAMGEFALRGYNVAMPEMDIGDDLFVVNDATGAMWRIQVKTSVCKRLQKSFSCQFAIRENAISTPMTPDLHFVFACRANNAWRFLVISRGVLLNYVQAQGLGTATTRSGRPWRQIYLSIRDDGTTHCSNNDLTHLMEDWSTWPTI